MRRSALTLLTFTAMLLPTAATFARDPGPLDVRGRGATPSGAQPVPPVRAPRPSPVAPPVGPGYNPAAPRFDDVHGPPPRDPRPERRRLYEQVEDGVDRGNGRIEDEQTYQLRRMRDDRDERLGRIPPRREAERVDEEYDRRRRIAQQRERPRQPDRAADAARGSTAPPRRELTALDRTPNPAGSTMARFVAEQAALLDAARARYQRDLGTAESQRDAAVRAADTREAAAAARRRFDARRAQLTRQYQAYRRKVLGTERPSARQ